MIRKEWTEYLLDEYRRCRLFPGWSQIFDEHDKEDQEYFEMLEESRESGCSGFIMEIEIAG